MTWSASFLDETPLRYHHDSSKSVKSTSMSFNELTTLLPFAPFTLTCSISTLATTLKKLSSSPALRYPGCGLHTENPVGGSWVPVNEANVPGDTWGNTRFSKSVTCKTSTFTLTVDADSQEITTCMYLSLHSCAARVQQTQQIQQQIVLVRQI